MIRSACKAISSSTGLITKDQIIFITKAHKPGELKLIPCVTFENIAHADKEGWNNVEKRKGTGASVIENKVETAKDMNHKYKETSEGGLAVKVSLSDC